MKPPFKILQHGHKKNAAKNTAVTAKHEAREGLRHRGRSVRAEATSGSFVFRQNEPNGQNLRNASLESPSFDSFFFIPSKLIVWKTDMASTNAPSSMKRILSGLSLLAALALPLHAQVTDTRRRSRGKVFPAHDAVTVGINRDKLEPAKYTALGLASSISRSHDAKCGCADRRAVLRCARPINIKVRAAHVRLGDTSLRTKWTFWRNDQLGRRRGDSLREDSVEGEGIGNNHMEAASSCRGR